MNTVVRNYIRRWCSPPAGGRGRILRHAAVVAPDVGRARAARPVESSWQSCSVLRSAVLSGPVAGGVRVGEQAVVDRRVEHRVVLEHGHRRFVERRHWRRCSARGCRGRGCRRPTFSNRMMPLAWPASTPDEPGEHVVDHAVAVEVAFAFRLICTPLVAASATPSGCRWSGPRTVLPRRSGRALVVDVHAALLVVVDLVVVQAAGRRCRSRPATDLHAEAVLAAEKRRVGRLRLRDAVVDEVGRAAAAGSARSLMSLSLQNWSSASGPVIVNDANETFSAPRRARGRAGPGVGRVRGRRRLDDRLAAGARDQRQAILVGRDRDLLDVRARADDDRVAGRGRVDGALDRRRGRRRSRRSRAASPAQSSSTARVAADAVAVPAEIRTTANAAASVILLTASSQNVIDPENGRFGRRTVARSPRLILTPADR